MGTKDEGFDAAATARGMGCPLGKFTVEIKTVVDETTYAAWLRLCNAHEVTSSELLRDMIFLVVHKITPAEMAAKDRRALLEGEGRNGDMLRLRVVDPVRA